MRNSKITSFQIGKKGVNEGAIESLSLTLKNHKQIRIGVLRSSGRNRESIEKIALEIQQRLPVRCDYRIIGFKIILIKREKGRKK